MYIPDNLDLFDEYEAEQEQIHRQRERLAKEWEQVEHGLPFVNVPQDNGNHRELY